MSIASLPIAGAAIAAGAVFLQVPKTPPNRQTVARADSSTKPEPR